MTISASDSRWSYPGEILQTDFPYSNKIFAKSDLNIYVDGLLQPDSLYTVTGIGAEAGGLVKFFTAPNDGSVVLIVRAVSETQGTDLPIAGVFPAESVESMADKNTVLIQQVSDKIARALVVGDSDPDSFGAMPLLSTFFGKYLAIDDSGNPTPGVSVADQSVAYTTKMLSGDNAETDFTLSAAPASTQATAVFISGVRQVPVTDYNVTDTLLSFTSPPPTGTDNIFVLASQTFTGVPSDGSVTAAKFASLSAADSIIALAALGAASLAEANTFAKTQSWSKGADLTSAGTITPGSDGNYFDIAGSSGPIGDIAGSHPKGTVLKFHFVHAPSITHNATALILPGGSNIQAAPGDEVEFIEYDGAGNWRCTKYTRASGKPLVPSLFSGRYVSAEQTITAAGSLTFAHGLSVPFPYEVAVRAALICKTAELGYSIGDEVTIAAIADFTGINRGVSAVVGATNLNIRFGSAAQTFVVINKTTGASLAITNANWKIRFIAYV